jgi:hypothetical protein
VSLWRQTDVAPGPTSSRFLNLVSLIYGRIVVLHGRCWHRAAIETPNTRHKRGSNLPSGGLQYTTRNLDHAATVIGDLDLMAKLSECKPWRQMGDWRRNSLLILVHRRLDLASKVLMSFNENYITFVALICLGTANSIVQSDSWSSGCLVVLVLSWLRLQLPGHEWHAVCDFRTCSGTTKP